MGPSTNYIALSICDLGTDLLSIADASSAAKRTAKCVNPKTTVQTHYSSDTMQASSQ